MRGVEVQALNERAPPWGIDGGGTDYPAPAPEFTEETLLLRRIQQKELSRTAHRFDTGTKRGTACDGPLEGPQKNREKNFSTRPACVNPYMCTKKNHKITRSTVHRVRTRSLVMITLFCV